MCQRGRFQLTTSQKSRVSMRTVPIDMFLLNISIFLCQNAFPLAITHIISLHFGMIHRAVAFVATALSFCLLVCYTNRNGHPGRGVPTAETDTPGGVTLRQKRTPREGCPYGRNGHPGRGVPTAETDTPGGGPLRQKRTPREGCPYDRNGHPGGVPTREGFCGIAQKKPQPHQGI